MWKLAWDFFVSLVIRAVFTIALCGGVCFLAWTYHAWRTGFWEAESNFPELSFVLASVVTLVGLMGTFRRGRAEANFSLIAVVGILAGASFGHIHVPSGHAGGRTLRRFPSIESLVLGGLLIVLWAAVALWKEEVWPLRVGAIIGGLQILWGLAIERFGGASRTGAGGEHEPPQDRLDAR